MVIICWLSPFWRYFDLVKQAKLAISEHFHEYNTEGMASNLACWCILVTLRIDKILVTVCSYSLFWRNFDLLKQAKFGVSGIFFRMHGRNGLKFDNLIYPDHLWNWLQSGHGLLLFFIMASFWLRETGQMYSFQAFSWQCMGGMGRNLSCSSLTADIPRNEKGKFQHIKIIQLPSGVSLTTV